MAHELGSGAPEWRPSSVEDYWAVYQLQGDACRFAMSLGLDEPTAEEIAAEAVREIEMREVPVCMIRPALFRKVRDLRAHLYRDREALDCSLADLEEAQHPADGLMPLRACVHRQYNTLDKVPCAVCGSPYSPYRKNRGKPKSTCGRPKCIALLRERNRRERNAQRDS